MKYLLIILSLLISITTLGQNFHFEGYHVVDNQELQNGGIRLDNQLDDYYFAHSDTTVVRLYIRNRQVRSISNVVLSLSPHVISDRREITPVHNGYSLDELYSHVYSEIIFSFRGKIPSTEYVFLSFNIGQERYIAVYNLNKLGNFTGEEHRD